MNSNRVRTPRRNQTGMTRRSQGERLERVLVADDLPRFRSGHGATLIDSEGRSYFDLYSGPAVTSLGHGAQAVAEAVARQATAGVWNQGPVFRNDSENSLLEVLGSIVPSELTRVYFGVTGGEAIEAAIKIAQVWSGKDQVIAFWGGYHGRTRGALSATSIRRYRDWFGSQLAGVSHFPYPYDYRSPFGPRSGLPSEAVDSERSFERCLDLLYNALHDGGSGLPPVAAMVVEPVQGLGGFVVPPMGFLKGLRALCDEFAIALICDEIFTGFGRTGWWFACQRDSVVPDLMVVGKAMSGVLPISAVVGKGELMAVLPEGLTSSTFQGNAICCAAASASITELIEIDAPQRAKRIGGIIGEWASTMVGRKDVGDVRGVGAMWGVEVVMGPGKEPDAARARAIQRHGLEVGVVLYLGGHDGNVIGIVPPLTIGDSDLSQALGRAEEAFS